MLKDKSKKIKVKGADVEPNCIRLEMDLLESEKKQEGLYK